MKRRLRQGPRSRAFLTRRQKFAVYGVFALLWISGAVWLPVHYFLRQQGPFGEVPNPAEHWLIVAHGAGAFAALWLGGWLWRAHVTPWRRAGTRRNSGNALLWIGGVLIVSGWLLYYAAGDSLRDAVSLVHWIVGLAAALALLVHTLRSSGYRQRAGSAAIPVGGTKRISTTSPPPLSTTLPPARSGSSSSESPAPSADETSLLRHSARPPTR